VSKRYPLVMGRYLTPEEREDIKRLVPDTGQIGVGGNEN
jgi:hypothetical protein